MAEASAQQPSQSGYGEQLLQQLAHERAGLPNKTLFTLVTGGLRVRLTRSLVTMTSIVLAIAFFTYAGLNGQLYYNTAVGVQQLEDFDPIPQQQMSAAVADVMGLGLIDGMSAERRRELAGTLGVSQEQIEQSSLADALRARQRVVLEGLAAQATLDEAMMADVVTILTLAREQGGAGEAVETFESALALVRQSKRAQEMRSMLRDAGVSVQATMAGDTGNTWLIIMALLTCAVGIANAMLMSVTERFREIGTMKCLGAPDGLVVKLFLLESSMLGIVGAVLGIVLGVVVGLLAALLQFGTYGVTYFPQVEALQVLGGAILAGLLLAVIGAVYPAAVAARMTPVDALRVEE